MAIFVIVYFIALLDGREYVLLSPARKLILLLPVIYLAEWNNLHRPRGWRSKNGLSGALNKLNG